MNDLKNSKSDGNKKIPELSSVSTGRRQLTKAGLIAPVLMSFSSRPAWAVVACSVSGMLSGNLSGPFTTCDNTALSVDYWDVHRGDWGGLDLENLNNYFNLSSPSSSGGFFLPSNILVDIFDGTATPYIGTGKEHCAGNAAFKTQLTLLLKEAIASVLNAGTFPNYPLTVQQITTNVSNAYNADNVGSCGTGQMDALTTALKGLNDVNLGNEGL